MLAPLPSQPGHRSVEWTVRLPTNRRERTPQEAQMYLASQRVFHPHLGTTAALEALARLEGSGQSWCRSQVNCGQ